MKAARHIGALALTLAAAVSAAQDSYQTTATGVAAGTKTSARPEAILNAQRDIVLSYFEAHVPREALPALRPLLEKPGVYVSNYKVAREDYDNGLLTLQLRAHVSESALRRDMGLMLAGALPRGVRTAVLAATDDENLALLAEIPAMKIEELLGESPIEPADQSAIDFFFEPDIVRTAVESDRELAAAIARSAFAHVATSLWIETSVEPQEADTNVAICHVLLRVQLIDARDGRLIREMGDEAKVQSANPVEGLAQALDDVLETFAPRIVDEVLLACIRAAPTPAIEIDVTGLASAEEWDRVCNRAQSFPDAADPLVFDKDRGRMYIHGDWALGDVVRTFTGSDFDGFFLTVERAVGNSVVLTREGK